MGLWGDIMTRVTDCNGSIVLDTECGICERCEKEAELIMDKYKRVPLKDLPLQHRFSIARATAVLFVKFGTVEKFINHMRGDHA